jgi:hypothetical protein
MTASEREACAFCGDIQPTWEYPATPYLVDLGGGEQYQTRGPWPACDPCHALVEAEAWARLVPRGVLAFSTLLAPGDAKGQALIAAQVRQHHETFRRHRTGPARRLPDPPG